MKRTLSATLLAIGVSVFGSAAAGSDDVLFPLDAAYDDVDGIYGLSGASSVASSPDGRHAYVASYNDDAIAVLSVEKAGYFSGLAQVVRNGVAGVQGIEAPRSVAVAPDGSHLYASGEFYQSGFWRTAIAIFDRDAASGALAFKDVMVLDSFSAATSIAVTPDGRHLYADEFGFVRDTSTGLLTRIAAGSTISSCEEGIAIALDGRNLYCTYYNYLIAYSIDAVSGNLQYLDQEEDNWAGVDGLAGAEGVAVSSDGGAVYAAGFDDEEISTFSRDDSTGTLGFIRAQSMNRPGYNFEGRKPKEVDLSPDGEYLYVASSKGVTVFFRDAADGALTFAELHLNGTICWDIATTRDGFVLVVATNSLLLFAPEPQRTVLAAGAATPLLGIALWRRRPTRRCTRHGPA